MSRDKYSDKEKEMVLKILERSERTASVDISFGYTNERNQCINGIVLKGAPSAILEMLIKEGCMLHLESDGVHVMVV